MSEYSWLEFQEVFDMPMSKTFSSPSSCFLELTLNYPRNTRFKRLIYKSKVKLYEDLLSYLKTSFKNIDQIDHYVENCSDGTPHVHAMIACSFDESYSAEGVTMDIVNILNSQMPMRSQLHAVRYSYNPYLKRYLSPCICINYKESSSAVWNDYIRKDIKT